ncbi:MAG: BrnT family toxin [Nostoc sp.]|uniref:BrnT family toxin n=1 Tax=Nostoc sp. TaxID=1180 RepID=UPI002FF2031B
MTEAVLGFDWDDGNIEKCQKHGVSLEEIEALFLDKSLRISPDIKHSESEDRFIATGVSIKSKYIFVGFTFREKEGKRLIRPISTRYMRDKEAKKYEENIS